MEVPLVTEIRVNFGSLSELEGQVNQAAQQLLAEIEDIKSIVNNVHSYWEGSANEQFNAKYQELDRGAREVQDAINQFGAMIGRSHATYMAAETHNKNLFA